MITDETVSVRSGGTGRVWEHKRFSDVIHTSLRNINLSEVVRISQVLLQSPMYLCSNVSEDRGNGEGVDTQLDCRVLR